MYIVSPAASTLIFLVCASTLIAAQTSSKEIVVFDGNVYYVSNITLVDWEFATTLCQDMGMGLVSLDSVEKETSILNHVQNISAGEPYQFWTSGGVVFNEWIWTNKGHMFTYTNWADGEPSNTPAQEPCMLYRVNFGNDHFHAARCTDKGSVICEMPSC